MDIYEWISMNLLLLLFLLLLLLLILLYFEYCVQFCYNKDIESLQRVQQRITEKIPRLRNVSFEGRLNEIDLVSLSKQKAFGDLTEVFRIFKRFHNMNTEDYFTVYHSNITRTQNSFEKIDQRFLTNEAKHFFSY